MRGLKLRGRASRGPHSRSACHAYGCQIHRPTADDGSKEIWDDPANYPGDPYAEAEAHFRRTGKYIAPDTGKPATPRAPGLRDVPDTGKPATPRPPGLRDRNPPSRYPVGHGELASIYAKLELVQHPAFGGWKGGC